MTIGTTISAITVSGNGVTTSFAYPFLIPNASNAVVTYTSSTGAMTALQPTQYTITGIGNKNGGTVTYPTSGSPIPSGSYLTIQRYLPLIQSTSISTQGPTFAAIESELDYEMMVSQQIAQANTHAITGNITDPPGLNYQAPPVAQRALRGLGFDSSGNVIAISSLGSGGVSSAMAPVVAAVSVAAAVGLLGALPSFSSIAALRSNVVAQPACLVLGYYAPGDQGGGLYEWISTDTTSADNGGSIIIDANGRRWHLIVYGAPYSVKQFGAKGDGSTDDGPAIRAAIAAAQASPRKIWFPPGNFIVASGTLAFTAGGSGIIGSGIFSTTITFTNGASDCITFIGTSYASTIYGFEINDIGMNQSGKTGGRLLVLAYSNHITLRDIYVASCWTGIEAWVNNTIVIDNVQIQGISGGANVPTYYGSYAPPACYGLYWHAPGDNSARSDQLSTRFFLVQGGGTGAYGFVWDGLANSWCSWNDTALNVVVGLLILNSAESGSYFPVFGEYDVLGVEGCSQYSLLIQGGQQFQFVNCIINNNSGEYGGGADINGLYIAADTSGSYTNSIMFSNCRIGGSHQTAAVVLGRDVQFSNCTFNGSSTTPNNTYAALHIAAPAQDIVVTGCKFETWGIPRTWAYGVQVDNGTYRVLLEANLIYNAQSRAIIWSNTDNSSASIGNLTTPYPAPPDPSSQSVSTGVTLLAAWLAGGALALGGPGSAWTAVTDTAAAIVAAWPNPKIFGVSSLIIANGTGSQMTLSPGSGVSFTGNTSGGNFVFSANATRTFAIDFNNTTPGSESVIIYG